MVFQPNVCSDQFTAVSRGTGDFAVGSGTNPASVGAIDGKTYTYYAQSLDGSQWESGSGAWHQGTSTLQRTTIVANSDNTATPCNFTTFPLIGVFPSSTGLLELPVVHIPVLSINIQVFTATGTYTPTAGMVYCILECVGSGAGSGGVVADISFGISSGGGGGGSYARKTASAATIGASQAVTVGNAGAGGNTGGNNGAAGGDVSVGTLCIGKGGSGGGFGSSGALGGGGAGGVAGTGDVTIPGEFGSCGTINSNTGDFTPSGRGGSSHFGGGGGTIIAGAGGTVVGRAGSNYGSGGSGSSSQFQASTNLGGAAGSKGLVVITEWIFT